MIRSLSKANYQTVFLEDDDSCTVTVTAGHYSNMLKNFFFGIMLKVCCKEEDMILKDGTTPYGTKVVLKIVKEKFGRHVISCWMTCVAILKPRNNSLWYILWGYVKSKVFEIPVNDLVDLKSRVVAVIG